MDTPETTAEWYYERAGAQAGPVTQAVMMDMLARGEVFSNTLIWRTGLENWVPLGSVMSPPPASAAESAPASRTLLPAMGSAWSGDEQGGPAALQPGPGTVPCSECGRAFPSSEILDLRGHRVCAGCKPVVLQKMAEGVAPMGGDGVWRSGPKLVFRSGASLPGKCIKCGQPSTTRQQRTLYWHAPWIYILVLVSLLIYVVLALVLRKKAEVAIPLCEEHRKARSNGLLTTWLLVFGVIGSIVGGISMEQPWFFLLGLVCFIAAIVVGVRSRLLVPTLIDDNGTAHAKGCCEEFLRSLPTYRD
ncbi:MAG: DUF4339 domain-containing protein [Verrucomicrobiaceae bacterium]|nr:DUF4339 domain-containing protein [Verrucomicrobiaceae bacterium]